MIKNFFFLLVAIFSASALFLVSVGVTQGSELTPFNTGVEDAMILLRTPLLTKFFLFVTNIGSPFSLTMFAIIFAIVLLWKRDTYDAFLYLVSILVSIVAFVALKNYLHIPRPTGSLIADLSSWSYPSGHATVATAFFFATAYSFFDVRRSWQARTLLLVACVLGAGLVSFSRVYLGAHFALDVLGGAALGLLCVSVTLLIFNLFIEEREWWRGRSA